MAQDNDAEISTKFSTLNVNAMEFVPGVGFTSSSAPPSSQQQQQSTTLAAVVQQQQQQQEMSNNSQPPPPNPDPVIQPPTSLPLQDKVTDEFDSLERRETMNGNGRRK